MSLQKTFSSEGNHVVGANKEDVVEHVLMELSQKKVFTGEIFHTVYEM
jgi:hypothetical protein